MTQAGNLRNHADDCTTDLMNTRAVQLGKILSLWGPDGVGHSPSDPSRPKRSGSRLSRDRVCRETGPVERQGAWSGLPPRYSFLKSRSVWAGSREVMG